MITSLELENFQNHKHSLLEFHTGMNVIVGASDSGKSAIIRGIKLLKENRPLGTSFVSWWARDKESCTKVKLVTSEGNTIIRADGKERYYKLNNSEFPVFKTETPVEIRDVLNMDETNFQFQLDSHFLLSQSAGAIAQFFNKVAKLTEIDTATSNVKSWIMKINSSIKQKEADLEETEAKLAKYKDFEKVETLLEAMEELDRKRNRYDAQADGIDSILDDLETLREENKANFQLLELKPMVDEAISLIVKRRAAATTQVAIETVLTDIKDNRESVEKYKVLVALNPLVEEWFKLNNDRLVLAIKAKAISRNLFDLKYARKGITESTTEYNRFHDQYEREYPDVCPFCQTNLKKKK